MRCLADVGVEFSSRLAVCWLLPFSATLAFVFFGVLGVWVSRVSVDGLCPEEGFKGVRVSRSIVVVVLVGFLA